MSNLAKVFLERPEVDSHRNSWPHVKATPNARGKDGWRRSCLARGSPSNIRTISFSHAVFRTRGTWMRSTLSHTPADRMAELKARLHTTCLPRTAGVLSRRKSSRKAPGCRAATYCLMAVSISSTYLEHHGERGGSNT